LRLEGIVPFIDLIDEQNTTLATFDRFEQWTCHEIRAACHLPFDFGPNRRVVALLYGPDAARIRAAHGSSATEN
jgi:hypothetical protein